MTQMCEICRAVPPDFLVLSGDDALTLPLMAVGGRGIISVASNEIPAEMAQMVEAAERDDFAAARAIHARILPLMQINFVESNPVPVKAAMAAMGLLEEIYRLPMVSPRAGVEGEDSRACSRSSALLQGRARMTSSQDARCRSDIERLVRGAARRPTATRRARRSRGCARRCRPATVRAAEPDAVEPARLARQRLGEAGHPARLQVRRHRRRVDGSRQLAVLRQGHAAAEEARRSAPASASCPADRRCATARISRRA